MVDSHCHLNMFKLENGDLDYCKIENTLKIMKDNGVDKAIVVGSNFVDSELAIQLAQKYENLFCAVGFHPDSVDEFSIEKLEELINKGLQTKKLVAVGEIGLDYHFVSNNKEIQIQCFEEQIKIAKKFNLPIIVHSRDASKDVLETITKEMPIVNGGIIHCYSSSLEWAKEVIKLGFMISFSGSVTFNNAKNLQNVAKEIAMDKILVETDSPFLAPVPLRGQENNPANVIYVAKFIANLKNMEYGEFEKQIENNFNKFFKIN